MVDKSVCMYMYTVQLATGLTFVSILQKSQFFQCNKLEKNRDCISFPFQKTQAYALHMLDSNKHCLLVELDAIPNLIRDQPKPMPIYPFHFSQALPLRSKKREKTLN